LAVESEETATRCRSSVVGMDQIDDTRCTVDRETKKPFKFG
jgi:hypothetical protein